MLTKVVGLDIAKRKGGGPAPLLKNPSIAASVVLMLMNGLVLLVSGFGVAFTSVILETCPASPMWGWMFAVLVQSFFSTFLFGHLALTEWAPDDVWKRRIGHMLFVVAVQVATTVIGVRMVHEAFYKTDCWETAWYLVRTTLVCCCFFTTVVCLIVLTLKFYFFPHFVMQVKRLALYK